MDIIGFLVNIFADQNFLIRITLVILLVLYGFFALIIAIQISNLNKTINQIGFSGILNFIAALHVLASLALLVFAVLSL